MTTIATVGVLGGGLMGSGIAQVAALNGFTTIVREIDERAEVAAERCDAFVPSVVVGRRFGTRPISGREVGRDVLRIARKLENVRLRDAEVLQQLPGRMWTPIRPLSAKIGRKVFHRVVEADVGVASIQELHEMVAKIAVATHEADP